MEVEDEKEDEEEEEDDEEEEGELIARKVAKRRGTNFVYHKQGDQSDEDEEDEFVEDEVVEEQVVKNIKVKKRRATSYNRKQYDLSDADEEVVDQEPESPKRKPVYKHRGTSYVRSSTVNDDVEEGNEELLGTNASGKKKTALFVDDDDLEKIRVMSKLCINKADSDSEEEQYVPFNIKCLNTLMLLLLHISCTASIQ